jgi:hypothetical protein
MQWNRNDICLAYWAFASRFHEGQSSRGYAILSRLALLRFEPGAAANGCPSRLSSNAKAIYQQLVERHCGRWSTVLSPRTPKAGDLGPALLFEMLELRHLGPNLSG